MRASRCGGDSLHTPLAHAPLTHDYARPQVVARQAQATHVYVELMQLTKKHASKAALLAQVRRAKCIAPTHPSPPSHLPTLLSTSTAGGQGWHALCGAGAEGPALLAGALPAGMAAGLTTAGQCLVGAHTALPCMLTLG